MGASALKIARRRFEIYTLTPNPVLDLSGTVERIIPNEKNYVLDEVRGPGGNGINVARVVHRLGGSVLATGFLGGGVGEEVRELLEQEGVQTDFVSIQNETRVNVTVSELRTHLQTRLSFPGPSIGSDEKEKLFQLISKIKPPALLMIGGSFPPGFSIGDLKQILKICRHKKIHTVIDCPGTILKEVFRFKPILIKPNLVEFQQMTGKRIHQIPSVVKEARKLSAQVPLICVSSVEEGTLMVTPTSAWFGRIPQIKVKSSVGAGDSMVGAMIFQIQKLLKTSDQIGIERMDWDEKAAEILKWGLASAAASLSHSGTALGKKREVQEFSQTVSVSSV